MITLLPFQQEGVEYALKRRGTIIADEMGLGKTVQAIGLINADSAIETVLIICPLSLKANWWKELERCLTRTVNTHVIHYEQALKHRITAVDLVIIDEGQFLKNQDSQRTKAVTRIAKEARKVVILTGTPFENRVSELWPLLCIANPEHWNPVRPPRPGLAPLPSAVVLTSNKPRKELTSTERNYRAFRMRYCGPVRKTFYKGGKQKVAYDFSGGSNLEELNRLLRNTCMIRRFKQDVLSQLPPKTREIVTFPTKIREDPLFTSLLGDITIENYNDAVRKLHANKVAFTEWSRVRHLQGLEKLDLASEYIETVLEKTDKVILFAHHEDVILELDARFPGAASITGKTPPEIRQAAVDRFQNDPRTRVFIGSIRAAGVGLTLTAASTVIFVEIDPNPGIMNQCEDRAHRITQTKHVHVQYLVSDGSIDARLCQILAKKQDLLAQALDRAKGELVFFESQEEDS